MILSMTGYGDANRSFEGIHYTVEVRSVNNRYFKAAIKLPDWLSSLEMPIEKLLRDRLNRGSVTYHLKTSSRPAALVPRIDVQVLGAYLDQLQHWTQTDRVAPVDVGNFLELPGVLVLAENASDIPGPVWDCIRQASEQALDGLLTMRRREGQALAADLSTQLVDIRRLGQEVADLAPRVLAEYQERLRTRVNQLLSDVRLEVDHSDLLRETALFAERCDINEELSRLTSHVDQFENLVQGDDNSGRKLEFLAQEMLREANTIGSKASDAQIAQRIVEIKSRIDRLKEQVLNVE